MDEKFDARTLNRESHSDARRPNTRAAPGDPDMRQPARPIESSRVSANRARSDLQVESATLADASAPRAWVAFTRLLLPLLLAPHPAPALDFSDRFLAYHEDFVNEKSFPSDPEADGLGAGGVAASAIPTGPLPTLEDRYVQAAVGVDGPRLHQLSIPIDALGQESIGLRARFDFFRIPTSPTAESRVSLSTSFEPGPGQAGVVVIARVVVTQFAIGAQTVRFEIVEIEVESGTGLISTRSSNVPLGLQNQPFLAGAPFTIDLEIDRDADIVHAQLDVEGAPPLSPDPLPLEAAVARPHDNAGLALFIDETLDFGPTRVRFDSIEIYRPFSQVFAVNALLDELDLVPGDGDCLTANGGCSLRAAIQETNATPGPARIELPASACCTLTRVGTHEDAAATGDLDILDDLEIAGRGTDVSIIAASGIDRAFHVPASALDVVVRLSDLSIRNGRATASGSDQGGAIETFGQTKLSRCRIENNGAQVGGGISNRRALILEDCVVKGNTATNRAGGLASPGNASSAVAPRSLIRDSAIVANDAPRVGGAEFADSANVRIEQSTLGDNEGTELNLLRSDALLQHVTIVSGPREIGLNATGAGATAPRELEIVSAAVVGEPACDLTPSADLTIVYAGHNASEDASCGFVAVGSLESQPLLLGPRSVVGESEAFVQAQELSPLIDAADPDRCPYAKDQAGTPRPVDGLADGALVCDIGAIEVPEPTLVSSVVAAASGLFALARRRRRRAGWDPDRSRGR